MITQDVEIAELKRDNEHRRVGHAIRVLESSFKRCFMKEGIEAGLDEVTIMHGWIMGYLYRNLHKDIYQKTIESEFCMSRSTVTTVLQLMEKKGYILRVAVPGDARLKKLVLTDLGKENAVKSKNVLDSMEISMLQNITAEELACFYKVADKIAANLTQKNNGKGKEE